MAQRTTFRKINKGSDLISAAVSDLGFKGIPPTDSAIVGWLREQNILTQTVVEIWVEASEATTTEPKEG